MADAPIEPDHPPEPDPRIVELERDNAVLARRLKRLEANVREMESMQDSSARLLTQLTRELEEARASTERLLLTVLPRRIVTRLESGETLIADRHDAVTVLFSDLVGFTTLSADLPVDVLVQELTALFARFDDICLATGVEKIKTIGDAYMAVGGLPDTRPDHADAIAETAVAMIEAVETFDAGRGMWRIRLGIHTGPCVAGVIGASKSTYDVWGDTVNVANRLQTTGSPGRIQLSEETARGARRPLGPGGSRRGRGEGQGADADLLPPRSATRLTGRSGQPRRDSRPSHHRLRRSGCRRRTPRSTADDRRPWGRREGEPTLEWHDLPAAPPPPSPTGTEPPPGPASMTGPEPAPGAPVPPTPKRSWRVSRTIATAALSALLLTGGVAAVVYAASPEPSASPSASQPATGGGSSGGTTQPTHPKGDCPNMGGSSSGSSASPSATPST